MPTIDRNVWRKSKKEKYRSLLRMLFALIAGGLPFFWVAGCAHQYAYGPVQSVGESAKHPDLIPIFLPKTIIDFNLHLTITCSSAGAYTAALSNKGDPDAILAKHFAKLIGIDEASIILPAAAPSLKSISISDYGTRGVRDPSKLFMVEVPKGLFKTTEFGASLNPEGVVSGVSSSVEDHTFATVIKFAKTVLSRAPVRTEAVNPQVQPPEGDAPPATQPPAPEHTPIPDPIYAEIQSDIQRWTLLQTTKNHILIDDPSGKDGAALKWIYDQAASEQDSIASKFTGATEDKTIELHISFELDAATDRTINPIIDLGALSKVGINRNVVVKSGEPIDVPNAGLLFIDVGVDPTLDLAVLGGAQTYLHEKHGLPYVVPSLRKISIGTGTSQIEKTLLSESTPIAQYGVVRYLPPSLHAFTAVIKTKHYEATGALSEITTSTTAVDSDSIVTPIAAIQDRLKAKADAKAAADAEAAAKEDELAKLTREANILEQKAKIKELQSKAQ